MTIDVSAADASARAERAVEGLAEMSVDLRACAILGPDGARLAASVDDVDWEGCASELWESAAEADRPAATQVHVATENGEVFAARTGGGVAIAVTERFALASLMFCDLRAALRDLEDEGVLAERTAG
jgi:hypothetical protein